MVHFQHLRRLGILRREPRQCVVERQDLTAVILVGNVRDWNLVPLPAMFEPLLSAGIFHPDSSHCLGRRGKQVPAPVPLASLGDFHQPQIGLNGPGPLRQVFGPGAPDAIRWAASLRSSSQTSGSSFSAAIRSPRLMAERMTVTSLIQTSMPASAQTARTISDCSAASDKFARPGSRRTSERVSEFLVFFRQHRQRLSH